MHVDVVPRAVQTPGRENKRVKRWEVHLGTGQIHLCIPNATLAAGRWWVQVILPHGGTFPPNSATWLPWTRSRVRALLQCKFTLGNSTGPPVFRGTGQRVEKEPQGAACLVAGPGRVLWARTRWGVVVPEMTHSRLWKKSRQAQGWVATEDLVKQGC